MTVANQLVTRAEIYWRAFDAEAKASGDVISGRRAGEQAVLDAEAAKKKPTRRHDPLAAYRKYVREGEAEQAEPRRPWDVLLNEWLTAPAGDVDPRQELLAQAELIVAEKKIDFAVALEEAKVATPELVERIVAFNRQHA